MFEKAAEQRRGGRAVHIIIAENGHLFPAFYRRSQPRGRLVHVGERARVGHQALDGGVEKRRRLVNPDAPARQNAGDNVGNPMMLRNRQRHIHLPRIQPLRPALAGGGGGDVEEGAAVGHGRSLMGAGQKGQSALPQMTRSIDLVALWHLRDCFASNKRLLQPRQK